MAQNSNNLSFLPGLRRGVASGPGSPKAPVPASPSVSASEGTANAVRKASAPGGAQPQPKPSEMLTQGAIQRSRNLEQLLEQAGGDHERNVDRMAVSEFRRKQRQEKADWDRNKRSIAEQQAQQQRLEKRSRQFAAVMSKAEQDEQELVSRQQRQALEGEARGILTDIRRVDHHNNNNHHSHCQTALIQPLSRSSDEQPPPPPTDPSPSPSSGFSFPSPSPPATRRADKHVLLPALHTLGLEPLPTGTSSATGTSGGSNRKRDVHRAGNNSPLHAQGDGLLLFLLPRTAPPPNRAGVNRMARRTRSESRGKPLLGTGDGTALPLPLLAKGVGLKNKQP
eukprot:TRINITY_DN8768_c0_g1_i3.p1 TRINITY_DN8768_c0_g1~~TRINITY_DN8768_c0_g1_i3.p1  ORF type:complete len:338 (-),score=47.41 TRINITY_DN8768_c0_g1_i3:115-1128(-)